MKPFIKKKTNILDSILILKMLFYDQNANIKEKLIFLTSNIVAQINHEKNCNGESIPFVTKFTLLGVFLDGYLHFGLLSISLSALKST